MRFMRHECSARGEIMKNGKKAAFVAAAAGIFLVACGSRASETTSSGEMVVPEMSSEDLLVSSLEYLLLDKEEAGKEAEEQTEKGVKEPVMPEEDGNSVEPEQQEAEQNEVMAAEAVIYYGNGASYELNRETTKIQDKSPEELVAALAKHNILSLDTKVLSFKEEEQDTKKILYLDLSKAAGEYLRTMSKEAECIIIASLVNTFLENYEADGIYLLVEGKALTTSQTEYTEAVGHCTPDGLMDMSSASETEEVQCKLPLVKEKE